MGLPSKARRSLGQAAEGIFAVSSIPSACITASVVFSVGFPFSLKELLAQRVFSIACGYPDANDSARLGADPVHKMLLDRDPVTGLDLASQPTLSRFESAVGAKQPTLSMKPKGWGTHPTHRKNAMNGAPGSSGKIHNLCGRGAKSRFCRTMRIQHSRAT